METGMALSIVAIILAAGGLGYTAVSIGPISSDISSLRAELQTAQKESKAQADATEKALAETTAALAESEALLKEITTYDRELVAAALKEGALTIYSVRDQEDLVLFAQNFQKEFPGIKVTFLTAKNPELISRITAELKANQQTWDIYDGSVTAGRLIVESGASQPYTSTQATPELFPLLDPTGNLNFFGATIPVFIYNPNLVTDDELKLIKSLKTWDDLSKPGFIETFKGRVLMDHPSRGGPHAQVLAELQTYWNDDNKWQAHMEGLAKLEPRLFKSTGQLGRLVEAEEGAVGIIGLLHDVLAGREVGAPREFQPLSPLVSNPSVAIVAKLAPHPNAAKLFVEWIMSPDGQATYGSTLRSPIRLGFVHPSSLGVLFPDVSPDDIVATNNHEYHFVDTTKFIRDNYEPLFGPA